MNHAQRMACEILGGFRREVHPELVQSMAALYMFVFRSIVDGNRHRDEKKLDDALRVLEIERGTWQAVCEKLGSAAASGGTGSLPVSAHSTGETPVPPHHMLPTDAASPDSLPRQGFSWEA